MTSYLEIKQLPLNKTIEIPSIIIVVRAISNENNAYYL